MSSMLFDNDSWDQHEYRKGRLSLVSTLRKSTEGVIMFRRLKNILAYLALVLLLPFLILMFIIAILRDKPKDPDYYENQM